MMEVTGDPVLEDALTTTDTDMLYFPATKGTIASKSLQSLLSPHDPFRNFIRIKHICLGLGLWDQISP